MSGPAVSVIIPSYNRAALLPRAVDSVIAQTFSDWEIIVVDDGSTDATPRLLENYAALLGNRFQGIRQARRGCSAARNRGIDAAAGRFVAFLDSDDEYRPAKLERQLTLFQKVPSLGFVYGDYSFVDEEGIFHASAIHAKWPLARKVSHAVIEPGLCVCTGRLFDVLIRGYFIATIVGMVRREVLGTHLRFREDLDYGEEWLFYLQAARRCRAGFVDEPLCVHHAMAGSLTRSDKRSNVERYRRLLLAILTAFDDLSWSQRRGLRAKLADACRQLAFDERRQGRRQSAVRFATEALRHRPGWKTLRELIAARWQESAAPSMLLESR
jgi:glycosyltransferase involved in cell wall biosynthesis